jgi:hypothetical protein
MLSASTPPPRSLDEYFVLMDAFVSGRIGADEFESQFLELFQDDGAFRTPAAYSTLERVFWAVEAYVSDATLRDPGDLDSEQLRDRVDAALQALQALIAKV